MVRTLSKNLLGGTTLIFVFLNMHPLRYDLSHIGAYLPSTTKFNVDGFSRGNTSPTDCGGVLRSCEGIIIALFLSPIGLYDSNIAELLSIKKTLDVFLKSKNFENVSLVIESDYAIVINWCIKEDLRPWRLWESFSQIDSMIPRISDV
ncbi:hypothetical protein REPUB_Repub03eG0041900 [Reevesia pubescens]